MIYFFAKQRVLKICSYLYFQTPILSTNPLTWRRGGPRASGAKWKGMLEFDSGMGRPIGLLEMVQQEPIGIGETFNLRMTFPVSTKTFFCESRVDRLVVPRLPKKRLGLTQNVGHLDGWYHIHDFSLFYQNIRENVAVRLNAYLKAQVVVVVSPMKATRAILGVSPLPSPMKVRLDDCLFGSESRDVAAPAFSGINDESAESIALRCLQLHDDDRIAECVPLLERLPPDYQNEGLGRVRESCASVGAFLSALKTNPSKDGWKVGTASKNVKSWYKENSSEFSAGDGAWSFRIEGKIEHVSMKSVLASLFEVDLLKSWLPMATESELMESISRFRKKVRIRIGAPWPISDREACVDAFGTILEDGSIVALLRSVQIPEKPPARGVVRISLICGFHFEKVKDEDAVNVTLIYSCDVKMKLPDWLLNSVVLKFCGAFVGMLGDHARTFEQGGANAARLDDEVYNILEERMADAVR